MTELPPIGDSAPLVFVAGPCVLESREVAFASARAVVDCREEFGIPVVFKGSFDKANRSHVDAYRGPGLIEGLKILAQVKAHFKVPILTDVHLPAQCSPAAEVADVLQIPAFLCRQTDLLQAAGATGRPVNIKRGQFLDPQRIDLAVEKIGGPAWVTERGTTFGHGDLVFDPRALIWMRAAAPVLYDCTHSVQVPGGRSAQTGGRREMTLPLMRAAVAVGVDGLYAEVHPDPAVAKSDAATQLDPPTFRRLVASALALHAA